MNAQYLFRRAITHYRINTSLLFKNPSCSSTQMMSDSHYLRAKVKRKNQLKQIPRTNLQKKKLNFPRIPHQKLFSFILESSHNIIKAANFITQEWWSTHLLSTQKLQPTIQQTTANQKRIFDHKKIFLPVAPHDQPEKLEKNLQINS